MISATENSREQGAHVTMLALTHKERTQLRALLDRVIADVTIDRDSYRVTRPRDPEFGRVVRNGIDITELTLETERLAREFRRRL